MSDEPTGTDSSTRLPKIKLADDVEATLDPLATLEPIATLDPTATLEPLGNPSASAFLTSAAIAKSSAHNSRFAIVKLHAKGGLGLLSLATDQELSRTVALKEIQYQYAGDNDARARFVREAEITGRLEHPGIVPVYGFGVASDGRPYYAMRFIQGRSLKDAIDEYHLLPTGTSERSLKFRELLRCVIDVCNTIEYAHSHRVVHRDLKPANVMVGAYGETLVVDWGLAKSLDEGELIPDAKRQVRPSRKRSSGADTMDGIALGTPQYMSPEQASGRLSKVGPRSDIYSLGATLYHLLVGCPAFLGSDLTKLLSGVITGVFPTPITARADVPGPMNSICLKAMALKPEDRYGSAKALAVEIERWLADEPVEAHGEGFAELWYRRMRRHRSWVMGIATMVPVLLLVMSTAAFFVNSERIEAVKQRDIAIVAKGHESEQRLFAQNSERTAREQEQAAKSAAEEAGRALANLQLINGERAQADRDPSAAALWFHQALPLIEKYLPDIAPTHRIRLARLLRPLPRPVRVQLLPDEVRRLAVVHSLSPDGQYLILTGAMFGAAGFHIAKGEIAWPTLSYNEMMPTTCFSDDDKRLITGGAESGVQIWNLETGQAIGAPMATQGKINWVVGATQSPFTLSADGRFFAVCTALPDESMQIERFAISDATEALSPLVMSEKVTAVRFHPTDSQLMVATNTHVHFYDPISGEEIGGAITQPEISTARYSPDGRSIITASNAGYARLWDTTSRTSRGGRLDHRGPVREVVFSPQSDTVITLSADLSARLWDVATGDPIGVPLDQKDRPLQARFSQDGKAVVTIGLEHSVRVWDVSTGHLMAGPWFHPSAPDARFLGEQLLIAVEGRCVTWDLSRSLREGGIEFLREDQDLKVTPFAYFLGKHELVAIIDENCLWLVDPAAPQAILRTIVPGKTIKNHHLSADGQTLAICLESNEIQIWNLINESQIPSTITSNNPIAHFRLSDNGEQLLVADEAGTVHIWDVATKPVQGIAMLHQGLVRDSHFSPDGSKVITGSDDTRLRLWDSKTGMLLREPIRLREKDSAMAVSCVRFHPDGLTVAAGSDSDEVIVWEPFEENEPIHYFRLKAAVSEVRFSANGKLLGVAGYANSVLLWDWKKGGEPIAILPSSFFSKIAFAPVSSLVATAGIGSVSLWESQDSRRVGPSWQLQTRSLEIDANEHWMLTAAQHAQLWDIRPESRQAEDLANLIQALALRKIDERGAMVFLSSDEVESEFMKAKNQHPGEFDANPGREINLPVK